MKRFILPFLALFAISAPAEWHYDPEGRNLAQGDVELWNVTANGKALAIGENACNSTASEVDLSTGVADGWTVVRIERDAFAGHPTLSRVVFPDTLESIGDSAFAFCSNLACSVSLPAGLRGALDRTFAGSPVTGDVVVPDGVTSMVETFRGTRITSLVCGTGLEEVRGCDGLCAGCTALTNVEFRSGCSLGAVEFAGCTALRSVALHPGMGGEWTETFRGCTALGGDIVLPGGVTVMKETFLGTSITSFRAGAGLRRIGLADDGDGDFAGCAALTNCVLNEGLELVGRRAFDGCSALRELVVPDSVKVFAASFDGCAALRRVVMPAGLETVGDRLFSGKGPLEVFWRAFPKDGMTFGGDDAADPMWDVCEACAVTNWIRRADKASWAEAAALHPDFVLLPADPPARGAGFWKGGFERSEPTVLRWWNE